MPRLRIYEIEWDDLNLGHATIRATAMEIEQVLLDPHTIVRANKSGRAADYLAQGVTYGGRGLQVAFVYDPHRHSARPITAWEV